MPITRRQFNSAAAGALAGAALSGSLTRRISAQAPSPVGWRRLTGKSRAIEGMGGNALVFQDGRDVLLVDTKISPVGKLMREFVEAGGYEVTQVINTHHHADHTGGNFAWSQDTPVLAHEKASARIADQTKQYMDMIRRRDPDAADIPAERFAPTDTIPGDSELVIGDQQVIIRHFGPGHTDNDLVLYLPDENILHPGDLLFHNMHIFVDLGAGADTAAWLRNVEACMELCNDRTVVVPGHGTVTNISGLEQQREYLIAIRKQVADAIADGKSMEETYRMPLEGFDEHEPPHGLARALAAIYLELNEQGG